MLIQGYDDSPLVAGESLPARPGFWSNHLLAIPGDGTRAERPVPEWFGGDDADADAMSEVLFDPQRWPVFRVPADDGPEAVVIYRNLVGDYGIDYLLTHPGGGCEGHVSGSGLTWHELVRIADNPSTTAEGVKDTAARLLLLLPLLNDMDVPDEALPRLSADLVSAGAPQETADTAAEYLLGNLMQGPWHDPSWASPLSNG
ncbi:hypothetical protein [Streptomyces sp. NPDC001927]